MKVNNTKKKGLRKLVEARKFKRRKNNILIAMMRMFKTLIRNKIKEKERNLNLIQKNKMMKKTTKWNKEES